MLVSSGAGRSSLGPYPCPYSPECVEYAFCELRLYAVLRSSRQELPAGTICSAGKRPPTRSTSGRKERTQCRPKA